MQLTSSTTGFYLQLPNMFQLEYNYSENDIISILTVSGHADTSHKLKKTDQCIQCKIIGENGYNKITVVL